MGTGRNQRMDTVSKHARTLESHSPTDINSVLLGQITVYNCTLYALLSTFNKDRNY